MKQQLRLKQVEVGGFRLWCNSESETTYHALVSCEFVKEVWGRLGIQVEEGHGFGREKVALLCWAVWGARNCLVWKQKNSYLEQVHMTASVTLDQWRKAQDKSKVLTLEKWRKTTADSIKINTSAAMFAETGRYGFAFVVRDSNRNLVGARACCRAGVDNQRWLRLLA